MRTSRFAIFNMALVDKNATLSIKIYTIISADLSQKTPMLSNLRSPGYNMCKILNTLQNYYPTKINCFTQRIYAFNYP